jgi:hypothetical protein
MREIGVLALGGRTKRHVDRRTCLRLDALRLKTTKHCTNTINPPQRLGRYLLGRYLQAHRVAWHPEPGLEIGAANQPGRGPYISLEVSLVALKTTPLS